MSVMNRNLCSFLVLLLLVSCAGKNNIIEPHTYLRNYRGTIMTTGSEGFELRISLDKNLQNRHAECSYLSLSSGILKKGFIDSAGGYYCIENDSFSIYVADTLYMAGRYLDDKQRIDVSWSGSLGPMWDTCALHFNWPRRMTLELFHEDFIN